MLAGRNQVHNITSTDIILSHSSISFDISITQMWGAFVEGATVALATLDTRQDINELAIFIREARVTMTFFTPTQFAMIVEHSSEELRQCPDLRTASFIGEHLQPRLVRAIYDLKIPVTIWNEYGPSETTSQNTIYAVPYPGPDDRSIHIGRALPNSSVYIVNPRLKPVPVGVSGELCIGGPQVSQGYLSTSATMSCVFVENPFVSGPFRSHGWTRLYRTGDHAKFLRDGVIDLGGRISGDKQIKLRGHRIDTTEIESEIQRIPAGDEALPTIARTVVLARVLQGSTTQSLTDDRQLVAFVVSKSADSRLENQHIANTLQDRLRKTLNSYMVPSCYQFLTDLPTTVSGKVNRAQLMDMKLDPIFPEGSGRAAAQNNRTVEKGHNVLQAIKDAYRVVLKLPADLQIDDHDNFFRLGGQSVLVLRLQKTLKTKIDVQLRLMDLFKNATPLALNTIIEGEAKNLSSAISSSVRRSLDIDWDEEIKLPQDDRYWPKDPVLGLRPTIPTVSGVLLVGADGFVGYYLLRFLLTVDSQAKVYLLSVENRLSLGELINSLSRYQLFDSKLTQSDLMRRVEIIPGTMAQDSFGLDAEEFDRLGQNVQSILHTGGFVSLLQTYTDLKERNVKSVRTMIELASCSRATTPTSLHYISTWSVLHMQTWKTTLQKKDGPVFTDEQTAESFQPPRTDDSGYIKTRWVSEMLMEEAGRRGFPTTIYRCPAHTAPIESTAVTPSDNFTINLYLSMIKAGIVPRSLVRNDGLESVVNSVPIDYLADTLVRLAGREDSRIVKHEACRLHVTNPSPMPFVKMSDMIAQVRCDRRPGTVMDIDEWFQSVLVHHTGNESQRLEWTMYKEYLDVGHTMFALDDRKSRPILAEIDMMDSDTRVRCPPVDAVYLGRLMAQKDLADKLA
jgi:thioester reductase-like protein